MRYLHCQSSLESLTPRPPDAFLSPVTLPPFQRLLEDHGRDVHRFLIATVGRDGADDCYQETFLSALRAYPRLQDASNLRAWLLTIAHHKAIDHLRARARRAIPMAEPPDVPGAPSEPADDGLWQALGELPPKQRVALALRYVVDAPYPEISRLMATTEEAARRNVHEALKRLRLEYQR
jgi:RNA polymerase sigma factor (sigma-70 family)